MSARAHQKKGVGRIRLNVNRLFSLCSSRVWDGQGQQVVVPAEKTISSKRKKDQKGNRVPGDNLFDAAGQLRPGAVIRPWVEAEKE